VATSRAASDSASRTFARLKEGGRWGPRSTQKNYARGHAGVWFAGSLTHFEAGALTNTEYCN